MVSGQLRVELASTADSVPKARHEVTRFAHARGIRADVVERMRLAVTEAVTNVVVHAYRFGKSGGIDLRAHCYGDRVDVEVIDTGVGMVPDPGGAGLGLGLPLIKAMTDRFDMNISGPGVQLSMCFSLN